MIENIPLSRVVSVALSRVGAGLQRTNMNIVCLMTADRTVLNSNERTRTYTTLAGVEGDFGTKSKVYQHASAIFEQPFNPINAGGGYLVVGYWRATDENVAATSGVLKSRELSEAAVTGNLQQIEDGSFSISVDGGVVQDITGVDTRSVTDLSEAVAILNPLITGATVTLNNLNQILITSDTTGATSSVSYMSEGTTGTYIGDILFLADGTGATITDGEDASVQTAESKLDAITAVSEIEPVRGCVYIDKPTSLEAEALSSYGTTQDIIFYDVFTSATNFTRDADSNFVWANKLRNGTNYRTLFDKNNDRTYASAYMSKMHSVNLEGTDTALTMHMKTLNGILPSGYSGSELTDAQKVGLDLYGLFGDQVSKTYTSGANDFTDNVYFSIAIKRYVQVDTFNFIQSTITKLAQTDDDVNKIIESVEATLDQFVNAGVIAPGTWNSAFTFGNVDVFKRSIAQKGYYVYAQSVSEQNQATREERKSPVIQVATKFSSAIHSTEIQIAVEA